MFLGSLVIDVTGEVQGVEEENRLARWIVSRITVEQPYHGTVQLVTLDIKVACQDEMGVAEQGEAVPFANVTEDIDAEV